MSNLKRYSVDFICTVVVEATSRERAHILARDHVMALPHDFSDTAEAHIIDSGISDDILDSQELDANGDPLDI